MIRKRREKERSYLDINMPTYNHLPAVASNSHVTHDQVQKTILCNMYHIDCCFP